MPCHDIRGDKGKEIRMAAPDRTRRPPGPTGWAVFAGVILLMVGFLNFFYGLAAILNDDVVVVGGHGAIIADLTAWGWITLILGAILVLTGFGLLSAQEWARWTAVFFATINAIAQIGVFPAAPLWAFIVILLDVLVIYNLTANWSEA
jgi:hypothetical protein